MLRLIIFFVFFALAIWLGLHISADPGYAMFAYQHWTVAMPFWLFCMAALVSFFLFYLLLRLTGKVLSLPGGLQRWRGRWQRRRALDHTGKGLLELIEGKWSTAEKQLVKGLNKSPAKGINYLAAAQAAAYQNDFNKRDKYLRKAQQVMPEGECAVLLMQAQLQCHAQQWERALATLRRVEAIEPHQPRVLQLLAKVYEQVGDWQSLYELLPRLHRYHIRDESQLSELDLKVHQGLLKNSVKQANPEELNKLWKSFARWIKQNPLLIGTYADGLIQLGQGEQAELLLRKAIKNHWDENLILIYGRTNVAELAKQLAWAESWLPDHKDNQALLLTLGRLCLRNQLWGKARTYFENSLALKADPETYAELAKLAEHVGDESGAFNYYRDGLIKALHNHC